jgi:uncharacterized protein
MTEGTRPRHTRREFLVLGTAYSLGIMLTPAEGEAAPSNDAASSVRRFDALRPLPPGSVAPGGWLRLYLEKQANQLAFHLPDTSSPFNGAYWAGEESPPAINGWWPWEQRAYWADGAMRCALVLKDQRLMGLARRPLEYTLAHRAADGYLGPEFAHYARDPDASRSNFRWPHNVFFRAMAAWADADGDPHVAVAIREHFLADRSRVSYGGPSRDVTNIEGMLWAYERTGDKALLDMATAAWAHFLSSAAPGDRESGDLHPARVFGNFPIHAHGVTYIEKAKLPALLYIYTGDRSYLRYALAAQERIFSHHMLIDGIPSTSEEYGETTAIDSHETCDIVDHMWSWGYLLMATGNGVWGDRIERACFNAGMGAIKKDWKALQYFSSPNQLVATPDSPMASVANTESADVFRGWMSYRPNPGHESACCGGNVHRLLPNYVIRMWMTDPAGGLVAALYGPSTLRANLGAHREPIEIDQDTQYPFEEEIRFRFTMAKPITFPVTLRIPQWCRAPELRLNGTPLTVPPIENGFIRVHREFHPHDLLSLTLPMATALTFWPHRGLGFENGPLVYALDVATQWSSFVTPKWSTEAYPEWSARPVSDWNFGIGVRESELLAQVQLTRSEPTADPWKEPPVKLSIPVKRISSWTLPSSSSQGAQTPPLPVWDATRDALFEREPQQQVSLSPYGATHLRLTIFPSFMVT